MFIAALLAVAKKWDKQKWFIHTMNGQRDEGTNRSGLYTQWCVIWPLKRMKF